ncbi:hypothetical protein HELRODRAFT_180358 [Helobdella robusta]|uniref:Uncharacterized protein n=1 Tax=Helobdella robusta TaxID=6412 RepID=T1FFT6_HELRO|nr:hypothetical protein HELRODRAFT_180358 [Helobdella robusta]ESN93949.1 hypothetical protein HELRODRAFT_180358 [Helobdella robusta]
MATLERKQMVLTTYMAVLAMENGMKMATASLSLLKVTASNTGKLKGVCTLLEKAMGRNLLWMACRHHMFEVLLADVFNVCLGPFTGPEILFFKRFREKWTEMNHTPEARSTPLIIVSDAIKAFIKCQLEVRHSRDDYLEFLLLAAQIVGLQRLHDYDDAILGSTGLKMMLRHSWYMSPELATLALFSSLLSDKEKTDLVRIIQADRGPHLMKTLPQSFDNLRTSKTFLKTSNIDANFLDVPVENWSDILFPSCSSVCKESGLHQ